MRLVVNKKEFNALLGSSDFPLQFYETYATWRSLSGQELVLFHDKENGIFMPACLWKSRFLQLMTCLWQPLCNGVALSQESERAFLNDVVKFVKKEKLAHRITAPENTAVFGAVPDNCRYTGFGTYKRPLYPMIYDEVVAGFQARYRTAVRQAEKIGVEVHFGVDVLDDFYNLHQLTMQRSGMPVKPKDYFISMNKCLAENSVFSIARLNNESVAAMLLIYTKHSAQYLYGCSANNIEASGAVKYLHAQNMKRLIQLYVKEYDFVGARTGNSLTQKLKGIQDFKSRFGTTLHQGFIWKIDIDPILCRVYDHIMKVRNAIWKIQPSPDIIEQETKDSVYTEMDR